MCDPDFQVSTDAHEKLNQNIDRDSSRRPWFDAKLREWRTRKAQEKFFDSHLQYFPSLIMTDAVLNLLITWADHIVDEGSMRRWIGDGWVGIKSYGDELLTILKRGQAMNLDEGEMFEEWTKHNDLKRKRIAKPVINIAEVEFQERREAWMIKQGIMIKKAKEKVRKKKEKFTSTTAGAAADAGLAVSRITADIGEEAINLEPTNPAHTAPSPKRQP